MMKYKLLLLFLPWTYFILAQSNPQFVTPIEGAYGEDFIIVNYPDWGLNSILDHNCGAKTYAKHAGTDFTLKSFVQMDLGVNILAADSGIVTFVHDGEFDRQTKSVLSRGLGNYIAIRHTNKMYSYYGHLKKNSIVVNPGDTVSAGDIIGQVGSSGNSTDPHLHFETWFDSLYLVDPFTGSCGNPTTLWFNPLPYDTTYNVWEYGTTGFVPIIDSLRERIGPKTVFSEQDSIITFWNLQYGVKKGDSSRIEWYTPQGGLWFSYTNHYKFDWWYYYYFSYIDRPMISIWGEWTYNYYHNDVLQLTGHFILDKSVNNHDQLASNKLINHTVTGDFLQINLPNEIMGKMLTIYSLSGQQISINKFDTPNEINIDISTLKNSEVYFVTIHHKNGVSSIKIIL